MKLQDYFLQVTERCNERNERLPNIREGVAKLASEFKDLKKYLKELEKAQERDQKILDDLKNLIENEV